MLHKINLACETEFNWIVKLQRDLLTAVCQPGVTSDTVTSEWVKSIRSDIDVVWLEGFCDSCDKLTGINQPLINHLKTIANADEAIKAKILANFEYNQGFYEAFDTASSQTHPLRAVSEITDLHLIKTLRGFFTLFYDPNLYESNGYPIHSPESFTRKQFLGEFRQSNLNIGVCVLCDGDLGDPDVDHFYSKKVYPDLCCHSANLVPICKSCNGRARKGEKAPLDESEADPMQKWFHPYYRSAEGHYQVDFEENDGRSWPVLKGDNSLNQERLDKHDWLVGLSERWHTTLGHVMRTTVKQFRAKGVIDFQSALLTLAENTKFDIGELPYGILRCGFFKVAAEGHALLLDELRIELSGADPVTG